MVDLSRLMQDAATLEVIEQSADECRTLSAQNSYQAMRIEELERKLSEARAALEEARKDGARLDWMEANFRKGTVRYLDRSFELWSINYIKGKTFRAAIDAAMKGDK